MDQLLACLIAREPREMIPILELVLHFSPLRLAFAEPVRRAEVVFLNGDDIADGAVLDAFHRFTNAGIGTPA